MSRSLKKGPFVDFKLAKKVAALTSDDRTIIKTWLVLARLLQRW
jgi:small subunit ribosomal protein S19